MIFKDIFYSIQTVGRWKGKLCCNFLIDEDGNYEKSNEKIKNKILNEFLINDTTRFIFSGDINEDHEIFNVIKEIIAEDHEEKIKFDIHTIAENEINLIEHVNYILEITQDNYNQNTLKLLNKNDSILFIIKNNDDYDFLKALNKDCKHTNIIATLEINNFQNINVLTEYIIKYNLNNIEINLPLIDFIYPRHLK